MHCEGGPQETKDEHVCWWLYKDVDLVALELWRIKMNKELCFILDNKNIYLDHILVDYEYVPIFFLM